MRISRALPLLALAAVMACLSLSAQAGNIILVTDDAAKEAGYASFLSSLGHTVSATSQTYRTLDASKIATLNAADLVVVSRGTDSTSYANDATEIANWNGLTAPILLNSGHIARNSRWKWVNAAGPDTTAVTSVTLDSPANPIVSGLGATSFNMFNQYYPSPNTTRTLMPPPSNSAGNGTLIGHISTGRVTIAEWAPGTEFYSGAGQSATAERIYIPLHNFSAGDAPSDYRFNDLTKSGQRLLAQAVSYATGTPLPATIASWSWEGIPHSVVGTGTLSGPLFSNIPNLSSTDYAGDPLNGVTLSLIDTAAHGASGPLSKLLDGAWPYSNDAPSDLFFTQDGDTDGKILMDLNALVDVDQINTFSRHGAERTAQRYSLFGSDALLAPNAAGLDTVAGLEGAGWTHIADVNTGSANFDGIEGVSVSELLDRGPIGTYRFLLFNLDPPVGANSTFYGEIDVVGQVHQEPIPEPASLGLLGLGALALARRRRRRA